MRATILTCLAAATLSAAEMKFVSPLPAETAVSIQRDIVYRTAGGTELRFDLYRPASATGAAKLPVVLFVNGVGNDMRGHVQYTGWGKLVTTIGVAGVVFASHQGDAAGDTQATISYLREHAAELGVDAGNIVLWACSANVGVGLPFAMNPANAAIKAAVFYYGVTPVSELRPNLPIFVVRAGLDGAGLNRGIDELVTAASARNLPLTFINLPAAHHAFDVLDDNDTSRDAIARTLEFIRTAVTPAAQRGVERGLTEAVAASAVYRGDWKAAVREYEALTTSMAADPEVHRQFGNALLNGGGDARRALAEYQRSLDLGDGNVGWISYAAATACMKLGDSEAALRWIEKLKDIPPMRRQLNGDAAFASLKGNPRFAAVADLP
jgi:acetyl esterase/lipase